LVIIKKEIIARRRLFMISLKNNYILKKVLPAFVILFLVISGIIKVDMINTKALSPLGNTNENYKIVNEKFGEDFSKFIKDNSYLKIYKEPGKDILIRLDDKEFKIRNKSVFIEKFEEIFEDIKKIINK
jgi:hypothetical protein